MDVTVFNGTIDANKQPELLRVYIVMPNNIWTLTVREFHYCLMPYQTK